MEIVNKYILKFYRSKFKDIRIIIESVCEQYINFEGGEKDVSTDFIYSNILYSKPNGLILKAKLIMKIKEMSKRYLHK